LDARIGEEFCLLEEETLHASPDGEEGQREEVDEAEDEAEDGAEDAGEGDDSAALCSSFAFLSNKSFFQISISRPLELKIAGVARCAASERVLGFKNVCVK
jgi:hypothetical protein